MTREDIIAFLGDHALLRGIPAPELRIAAASIEPVSFEDGRSLLVEGDTGTDCYFIKRGSVQVSSRNLVGKTLLLAELGPGALVGEIGLLRSERRTATVTAIGDVEALRLDRRSFELLAERSPLFHESLLLTVRIRLIHRLLRKASIWADIPRRRTPRLGGDHGGASDEERRRSRSGRRRSRPLLYGRRGARRSTGGRTAKGAA
ncbi:cyclic nucleotide-binding domain-containing protein [Cohnella ginsengisoli]|uniref:Cyclic nucleotide-binding domain-containing protein n=1 Tax=Cohnella ginsengisoli TaxID=425004 RepID=A0A9X4KIF1_9BACL|nr:cyclic nucleotide-binding domain-containing protein [Cohnella ginsengisoli]MDG0792114.1 cyclic nucleotide-binding domain-containing protein [Cohnella ginsengisoli]